MANAAVNNMAHRVGNEKCLLLYWTTFSHCDLVVGNFAPPAPTPPADPRAVRQAKLLYVSMKYQKKNVAKCSRAYLALNRKDWLLVLSSKLLKL